MKTKENKHLPLITIDNIIHKEQRYDSCGDYEEYSDGNFCDITVSRLSDWRYEALIASHELLEYIIVKYQKIPLNKIDEFDIQFEKNRKKGNTDEPGDDPKAPYHKAHKFSTMVEQLLAQMLKVKWSVYDKEVNSLVYGRHKKR